MLLDISSESLFSSFLKNTQINVHSSLHYGVDYCWSSYCIWVRPTFYAFLDLEFTLSALHPLLVSFLMPRLRLYYLFYYIPELFRLNMTCLLSIISLEDYM